MSKTRYSTISLCAGVVLLACGSIFAADKQASSASDSPRDAMRSPFPLTLAISTAYAGSSFEWQDLTVSPKQEVKKSSSTKKVTPVAKTVKSKKLVFSLDSVDLASMVLLSEEEPVSILSFNTYPERMSQN